MLSPVSWVVPLHLSCLLPKHNPVYVAGCRRAREEAERKEREEKQRRLDELRLKRKVGPHTLDSSPLLLLAAPHGRAAPQRRVPALPAHHVSSVSM